MEDLLIKLRKTYPLNYAEIKKAYDFAKEAHKGQKEVRVRTTLFTLAQWWRF